MRNRATLKVTTGTLLVTARRSLTRLSSLGRATGPDITAGAGKSKKERSKEYHPGEIPASDLI